MKQVDHHVHEVEQRPASRGDTLDVVRRAPRSLDRLQHALCEGADVRVALSNSFAFGGNNSVIVLRRWEGGQNA